MVHNIQPKERFSTSLDYILEQKLRAPILGVDKDCVSVAKKHQEAPLPLGTPTLPCPSLQGNPNPDEALVYLANAFAGTFDAMAAGTQQEVGNLGKMQNLDSTMSQMVVDSTNEAIAKELEDIALTKSIDNQINDIEAHAGGVDQVLTWVGTGLVVLVTILATIPTGGASDAALPEEIGGVAGDLSSVAISPISSVAEGEAEIAAIQGDAASDVACDDNIAEENRDQYKRVRGKDGVVKMVRKKPTALTDMFDKMGMSQANADRAALYFKRLMSGVGSGMCALPMCLQGWASREVGIAQDNLASVQANTGTAVSQVQSATMYFQFYQNLNKREGDVIQGLIEQTGDVVTLIGGILNGYSRIPTMLAQAV